MSQTVQIQQLQEENARLRQNPSLDTLLNNPTIKQALFEKLAK
jgi:hypothetical protein